MWCLNYVSQTTLLSGSKITIFTCLNLVIEEPLIRGLIHGEVRALIRFRGVRFVSMCRLCFLSIVLALRAYLHLNQGLYLTCIIGRPPALWVEWASVCRIISLELQLKDTSSICPQKGLAARSCLERQAELGAGVRRFSDEARCPDFRLAITLQDQLLWQLLAQAWSTRIDGVSTFQEVFSLALGLHLFGCEYSWVAGLEGIACLAWCLCHRHKHSGVYFRHCILSSHLFFIQFYLWGNFTDLSV